MSAKVWVKVRIKVKFVVRSEEMHGPHKKPVHMYKPRSIVKAALTTHREPIRPLHDALRGAEMVHLSV